MTIIDEIRCQCSNWEEEMVGWIVTGVDMSCYNGIREYRIPVQGPWSITGSRRETLRFEYDGDVRMIKQERWAKLFTLGEFEKMMCPDGVILVEEESDVV